ncbi:MAG: patatin-like phospholipase family protein [Scytonema sp. PMC 1069.18]|nr:patatin-like phospholipase family protein [Scytonema sp. PMC 1069.18]MEC4885358.1 patatin-like phospholipase family protein [Scytonema sp. PMC 1070.18]
MPFRILSLDGGGIRGVIAATILAEVEKRISQPLNKYFDLIAGTSTGSILGAAIATGRKSEEIVELYQKEGSTIFPYQSLFSLQRIPLLLKYGLSAPKYPDDGLIKVLREAFGETRLFESFPPLLLIVSYDTIERKPIIFKNWRKDKAYGNLPLWEACVCSSSAPTYFPAHKLDKKVDGEIQKATVSSVVLGKDASSVDCIYEGKVIRIISGTGKGQSRSIIKYEGMSHQAFVDTPWLVIPDTTSTYLIDTVYSAIDGGVAANNPSSAAIAEALELGYPLEEISVISIGTGGATRIIPFDNAQEWGLIQWAQPLIGVLFDASSDVYTYITSHIIPNERYLRLQFKLDKELIGEPLNESIDAVSKENIDNLIAAARVYINKQEVQKELEKFFAD